MDYLKDPNFCTLLVAVDDRYLDKLRYSFPTWVYAHPRLLNMDVVVMSQFDDLRNTGHLESMLRKHWDEAKDYHNFGKKLNLKVVPWAMAGVGQRERMLTALVHGTRYIDTPWYLKLDADTYANEEKCFYKEEWFKKDPAFIANPWGYSKPGTTLETLNSWANTVPELRNYNPVEGKVIYRDDKPWKVNHRRMASWVMFGNTAWCSSTLEYLEAEKLPIPSQDTYFSYLAVLTGKEFLTDRFRHFGWNHAKNINNLRNSCTLTMRNYGKELT